MGQAAMMRPAQRRQLIKQAGRTLISVLGISLVILVYLLVLTRGAILWTIL